jgi:two-component system KDP operon response regulator KdpE
VRTKVLVIDDDREMTEFLKVVLEPQLFDVTTTNSGREGVELARQCDPDVVILDMSMPGMDGLTVCREVRKFSNVPILILSAINKPSIVVQALDEGADDYLVKPMKNDVLIAHVNKLVRRARIGPRTAQTSSMCSA